MSTTITSAMPQSTKNACSPFARGAIIRGERCEYWDPNDSQALQLLKWKRPRMIFVCAHGDLFHESVPDEWIDRVFAVMALAPQHTFQVLTKRSKRMRAYLTKLDEEPHSDTVRRIAAAIPWRAKPTIPEEIVFPLPNVWLGVSVEDQKRANERVPDLLNTPAAVRFISAEPLLGPVDFTSIDLGEHPTEGYGIRRFERDALTTWVTSIPASHGVKPSDKEGAPQMSRNWGAGRGIDWVIVGGESGPDARPMHPDWARALRDQCASAGVPFFFKQWGANLPDDQMSDDCPYGSHFGDEPTGRFSDKMAYWSVGKARAGRLLDGVEHNAMPEGPQ